VRRLSADERSAIRRGAREACTTATDLRTVVEQVRSEAALLRTESVRLRDASRTVREGREPRVG
jgi:hypothetical protein